MIRRYHAAVVGCGRIGNAFAENRVALGVYSHAEAYVQCPQTELIAVCDCDQEKLNACGDRWNVPARYRSARELLEAQNPEIISICTPDETHFELAAAALAAPRTRAILLEKPLATDASDARALVIKARERGIPVAVNYSRRYAASHDALRVALTGGALGRIQCVSGFYTKGVIHNGTHWFDLARFLLGEVVRVSGFATRRVPEEDPALDARLEFASGATGYVHGCDGDAFTIFEMDVIGTKGRVRLVDSGHEFESFTVADSARYPGYRNLVRTPGGQGGMRDVTLRAVEDLVACLASPGRKPVCSADDALRALEIALAVRQSARSGEAVSL